MDLSVGANNMIRGLLAPILTEATISYVCCLSLMPFMVLIFWPSISLRGADESCDVKYDGIR